MLGLGALLLSFSARTLPCLRFLGLQTNEPEQELPSLLTMVSADPWSPPTPLLLLLYTTEPGARRCLCFPSIQADLMLFFVTF